MLPCQAANSLQTKAQILMATRNGTEDFSPVNRATGIMIIQKTICAKCKWLKNFGVITTAK